MPAPRCPYLDTVNRDRLDFDAQRACTQTLAVRNVYMCLVCGCQVAGRGAASPAHKHALDAGHHVFLRVDRVRAARDSRRYSALARGRSDYFAEIGKKTK